MCCGRKSTGLSTRGHAAHEHAIILRVDHGSPIPQQCSFAYYAGIVRQNCDPLLRIVVQKTQYQLINQCSFASATGAGEADDLGSLMFDVRCLMSCL